MVGFVMFVAARARAAHIPLARPSERPANGQDELRKYHDERVSGRNGA